MRKLVTIRKVLEVEPIEGADFIEVAHIGGWQCVVKKGEFQKGDMALYYEIDSFLPIEDKYEFLRKGCYKKMYDGTEGFRLKTIRLKKQLSQGLLLPLSTHPEVDFSDTKKDYAEELGVRKWEAPIPESMKSVAKGNFPTDIVPKTDQERIQNLSDWFDKYSEVDFEETEKLDGSSITYYINGDHYGVCSRNLELQYRENTGPFNVAEKYHIEHKLRELRRNIAIQGEIVGPGIQKNPLKLSEIDYYVYDVYDIDNKRYMTSDERMKIVKTLSLKHVPVLNKSVKPLSLTMRDLLLRAEGGSTIGDTTREGIVFKSNTLVRGQTISFKAISNKYLLKGD